MPALLAEAHVAPATAPVSMVNQAIALGPVDLATTPSASVASPEIAYPSGILQAARENATWHSPFVHGEGSSWHSVDSDAYLAVFCYMDVAVPFMAPGLLWLCSRVTGCVLRRSVYLCVALIMCVHTFLQHASGILILETFVGRPWIWLIMT